MISFWAVGYAGIQLGVGDDYPLYGIIPGFLVNADVTSRTFRQVSGRTAGPSSQREFFIVYDFPGGRGGRSARQAWRFTSPAGQSDAA